MLKIKKINGPDKWVNIKYVISKGGSNGSMLGLVPIYMQELKIGGAKRFITKI